MNYILTLIWWRISWVKKNKTNIHLFRLKHDLSFWYHCTCNRVIFIFCKNMIISMNVCVWDVVHWCMESRDNCINILKLKPTNHRTITGADPEILELHDQGDKTLLQARSQPVGVQGGKGSSPRLGAALLILRPSHTTHCWATFLILRPAHTTYQRATTLFLWSMHTITRGSHLWSGGQHTPYLPSHHTTDLLN